MKRKKRRKAKTMIDAAKVRAYKMRNTKALPNVKELSGKTVTPVDCLLNEYTAADGSSHRVLAVDFGSAGMYKTEVAAFIEGFEGYWEVFGEDAEKPSITITTSTSKRGNPYVTMTVNGVD